MDVIGWSLMSLPEDSSGRADSDLATQKEWWTPAVTNHPSASDYSSDAEKHDSSSIYSYTNFTEIDDPLNSSTESLPGWERLSDSEEFYEEQQCQSLPDCSTSGKRKHFERSNTVWYSRPDDGPTETKDLALKSKVISAWTNVTNGWVLKSTASFKCDSQIWLLGRHYSGHGQSQANKVFLKRFKLDFASRIWLTYRMDFPSLPGSQLRTDVGWGCMLRSGQMLLAQAFLLHFLGRDWMLSSDIVNEPLQRQIIRYFGDFFSDNCPFSIHKLVEIGNTLGRQTGDWFGPASVCVVLREALEQVRRLGCLQELSQIVIYLTMDCTLYKQDIIDLCTNDGTSMSSTEAPCSLISFSDMLNPRTSVPSTTGDTSPENSISFGTLSNAGSSSSIGVFPYSSHLENSAEVSISPSHETWRSLIILMPLRLGSETLNRLYVSCIKRVLESDLCIGIIGGRPKHSLYFVGWQDDQLIHLDPHCCQKTVDVLKEDFQTETFHCFFPRKLSFSKMDPTCAIGFYCKTRLDYERLMTEVPKMIAEPLLKNCPLFNFQEGRRGDVEHGCLNSLDSFRNSQDFSD